MPLQRAGCGVGVRTSCVARLGTAAEMMIVVVAASAVSLLFPVMARRNLRSDSVTACEFSGPLRDVSRVEGGACVVVSSFLKDCPLPPTDLLSIQTVAFSGNDGSEDGGKGRSDRGKVRDGVDALRSRLLLTRRMPSLRFPLERDERSPGVNSSGKKKHCLESLLLMRIVGPSTIGAEMVG